MIGTVHCVTKQSEILRALWALEVTSKAQRTRRFPRPEPIFPPAASRYTQRRRLLLIKSAGPFEIPGALRAFEVGSKK
jgi:hypothetical protein